MFNKSLKFISIIGLAILMLGGFVIPAMAAVPVDNLVVEFENTPLFNEANFLPNDTVTRWAKVTNNTLETQAIAVKAINYDDCTDSFCLADVLHLVITQNSVELYNDTLTNFFNVGEMYLSSVAGNGTQIQYDFNITFLPGSSNDYQGLSTYFDFMIGIQGEEVVGREEPGGGGGGGGGTGTHHDLIITDEALPIVGSDYAIVTWTTRDKATSNILKATSRVIYDTFSHPDISGEHAPNYGYMFSNIEDSSLITYHSMTITNLIPDTVYYFRPVSHASPEEVGIELTFTTAPRGEQPYEQPSGGTLPAPIFFNPTTPGTPAGIIAGEQAIEAPVAEPVLIDVETAQPQVAGMNLSCLTCPWWVWLVVIILHLWSIFTYRLFSNRDEMETEISPEQLKATDKKSYLWLWYILVVISLIAIYLLLTSVCKLPAIILAIVLLAYLVVLILYYFISVKHLQKLWGLVPLILAVGPVVTYFFSGSWFWWLWLLVLALYILSVSAYYYSIYEPHHQNRWWLTLTFLALLVIVLEYILYMYSPCLGA